MIQQQLDDAFALWLAGAGRMKNEREIWSEVWDCTTIEFPTKSPTSAIVRYYFSVVSWAQGEVIDGLPTNDLVFYPEKPMDYIRLDFTVD